MKKFLQLSFLFTLLFLLGSCAQSYRAVNPQNLGYPATNNLQDISLSYRYDVLYEKGNTKMAKKEKRYNVKVVAVKISNNSDKTINIGGNVAFYNGNDILYPLDALTTKNVLKQSVPSYLLYLLLSATTLTVNNSDPFPIGLILGPGIAGGNMIAAGNANVNLYKELSLYDVMRRDINPGETIYGLVCFANVDYLPLSLKFVE